MGVMLERIREYIQDAHDEVILWKRWDIKHQSLDYFNAMSRMYPFTHKYYFEANPSFVCDYRNLIDMQRQPLIMLRDGIVTLSAFFLQNIKAPKDFRTILLIPKRLSGVVPVGWKEHVAYYEIEYPEYDSQPIKKVYVHGMLVSYSFWFKKAKDVFDDLAKILPKGVPVEFMVPIRERSFFVTQDETKYVTPFMEELYERYGNKMKLHTNYDQLLNTKITKGSAFCELSDSPYIYADNYMNHLFSHENCFMINPPKVKKENNLVYPLSLNHNIIITKEEGGESFFNQLAFHVKQDRVAADPLSNKFHRYIKQLIESGLIKI
tara:strand:- start:26172 stop:27134 length:963 start_codon:yes stop_codon:yes gene_type:complete